MMNRVWWSTVSICMALAALVVAGCGGAGLDPTTTGAVTGTVGTFGVTEGIIEGVEGALVSIGSLTSMSDSTGQFSVVGVPAGPQQVITVTPPDPYVLVSTEPIYADVGAGQINELPEPILVISDSGWPQPPPPWSPD